MHGCYWTEAAMAMRHAHLIPAEPEVHVHLVQRPSRCQQPQQLWRPAEDGNGAPASSAHCGAASLLSRRQV